VQWLTGFTGSFGIAVVTPNDQVFLTDSRYTIQAEEQVKGFSVASFASPTKFEHKLGDILKDCGVSQLGFESTVTYGTYERWKDALPGVNFVAAPDLVKQLRMVKSADEIAKIQDACALADETMKHVMGLIQAGVTEMDVNLGLEFFIRRHGAGLAFEPIVVSGPNSARPHGKATERILQPGDFVTIDLGANLNGYNSDITRTFVVGPATDRHREIYDQVLKALLECTQMLVPGARCDDVDSHARKILDEKGFAKYFGHGLGHGLGRAVHDFGRLGQGSTDVCEPGQVWTVEPGVYIEGFGGVRIEDDVVVTDGAPKVLTHFPRELIEL
jgi:Xaa-Pro aminopeptidase